MNIALVAEVKWEVREVCRRLKLRPINPDDGVWGATLDDHDVRLCMSGMIPSVSKQRVDRFLDSTDFDLMICSGLAGALRDDIKVGDIIVQSQEPGLVEAAETALAAMVEWSSSPHYESLLVDRRSGLRALLVFAPGADLEDTL